MTAVLDKPTRDAGQVPLAAVHGGRRSPLSRRTGLDTGDLGEGLPPPIGWAADVTGAPVLTTVPAVGRGPVIPFVGLAEGLVLTAMRSAGVPPQRIRPALTRLDEELSLQHALASRRLHTDGADVLCDYAERGDDEDAARAARELVVVRSGQRVFNEVVASYLRRLQFADDGYAQLIRLPAYGVADVLVDPSRGFGQAIFARGGARLEDALAFSCRTSGSATGRPSGLPLSRIASGRSA